MSVTLQMLLKPVIPATAHHGQSRIDRVLLPHVYTPLERYWKSLEGYMFQVQKAGIPIYLQLL